MIGRRACAGVVIAMVAGWVAHYGCSAAPRPTSVLLVTLDTTRADRLSPYGLMDVSMPALDRLAREGIVFDQATSVAPLTLPAHTSIFTGLFPPRHRVRDNADAALSDDHATLAERLRQAGFRTAAFVASAVLDADRGLAQGFDRYHGVGEGSQGTRARQRPGNEVVDEALSWLGEIGDSPFFLWTHLYDPHRPYDPPEPYRSKHVDPYIAELMFVDAQVGRLIDALERARLLDRTIVVVVGDHGESLGDHGERDHGVFVYESVLRVPFIVRVPSVAPSRVGAVVRLVDVMPTVLGLLGMESPRVDGVSLVPLMDGRQPDPGLEAYAESLYPLRLGWSSLASVRDHRFKFIDAPRPELYDLARDPFEEHNIYSDRQSLGEAMRRRVSALSGNRTEVTLPSPELAQRLMALGYVTMSPARPPSDGGELPDPKDCIVLQPSPCHPASR